MLAHVWILGRRIPFFLPGFATSFARGANVTSAASFVVYICMTTHRTSCGLLSLSFGGKQLAVFIRSKVLVHPHEVFLDFRWQASTSSSREVLLRVFQSHIEVSPGLQSASGELPIVTCWWFNTVGERPAHRCSSCDRHWLRVHFHCHVRGRRTSPFAVIFQTEVLSPDCKVC